MENLAMKYTVMTVFQFDPPFVDYITLYQLLHSSVLSVYLQALNWKINPFSRSYKKNKKKTAYFTTTLQWDIKLKLHNIV